jgi:hypothetical protein
LLLLLLASCSWSEPSQSDIVGLWVEQSPGSNSGSASCATIEFRDDGRFEANDLPEEYLILTDGPPMPRVNTSGEWRLVSRSDAIKVEMDFDPNPKSRAQQGYTSHLLITWQPNAYYLYAWAGDETNQLIFKKSDTAKCGESK